MADREFIGENWFDKLIFNNIPFYLRLRENLKVYVIGKGIKKVFQAVTIPANGHIALPALAKGLYLAEVEVEGQRFTRKLQIE